MQLSRRDWLGLGVGLGLFILLLISLGFNVSQGLHLRYVGDDALSALQTDVDSALASLDAAVYLNTSRTDWNDPVFRLGFYKNLLQAQEAAAASSQLSPLSSGDPAAVAGELGELAADLNATYLPAAQRLASGQATGADEASLAGFCGDLQKDGWPLRAQLRDQGWSKLNQSLNSLLAILGPVSQQVPVVTVPVSPYEEPTTGGSVYGHSQQITTNSPSGISVEIGPATGG